MSKLLVWPRKELAEQLRSGANVIESVARLRELAPGLPLPEIAEHGGVLALVNNLRVLASELDQADGDRVRILFERFELAETIDALKRALERGGQ